MAKGFLSGSSRATLSASKTQSKAQWISSLRFTSRFTLIIRAQNPDNSGSDSKSDGFDSDFESLFSRELKRRGLEGGTEEGTSGQPVTGGRPEPFSKPAGPASKPKFRSPPPQNAAVPVELDDQRQRTLGFVNEGLEGLIPRGGELLKLGGSVFLGFLPFMLAFSLLFTGVYAVFGESFLHGGQPGVGGARYVDPQDLLSAPTVDPYIPLR